jgi:hypothetical protein
VLKKIFIKNMILESFVRRFQQFQSVETMKVVLVTRLFASDFRFKSKKHGYEEISARELPLYK